VGFVVRQYSKEITPVIEQRMLALQQMNNAHAVAVVALARFLRWAVRALENDK
jgi:hypothetical protein